MLLPGMTEDRDPIAVNGTLGTSDGSTVTMAAPGRFQATGEGLPGLGSPSDVSRSAQDLLSAYLISRPWTGDQKTKIALLRAQFNEGSLSYSRAVQALMDAGVSGQAALKLVNAWEDTHPGFDLSEFSGLGSEDIVLRPNQPQMKKERRERLAKEAAIQEREEAAQGDLFSASSIFSPVFSSLQGELSSRFYDSYATAYRANPPDNVQNTGPSGQTSFEITTQAGVTSRLDCGPIDEKGECVITSFSDLLGLFPEGVEEGDSVDASMIDAIVKGQGERDSTQAPV